MYAAQVSRVQHVVYRDAAATVEILIAVMANQAGMSVRTGGFGAGGGGGQYCFTMPVRQPHSCAATRPETAMPIDPTSRTRITITSLIDCHN
jgi:hypothetical protein